jgi:LuxR family maltose regulon positive regulatory protein
VQYWLGAGDLSEATNWATHTVFSPPTWTPQQKVPLLMQAQVLLAQGQSPQALALLEAWREQLDRPGDIETTNRYLALQLVALHQTSQREEAHVVAARLVALTEPEGNVRMYLDGGRPMQRAVQSLLGSDPRQEGAPALSRAFLTRVESLFACERHGARRFPVVAPALVVPLTQREQEVLRLLAEGATNQQIARALVIQLSTVKKHVSNLLSKLGATSRTQAIVQARTRALL